MIRSLLMTVLLVLAICMPGMAILGVSCLKPKLGGDPISQCCPATVKPGCDESIESIKTLVGCSMKTHTILIITYGDTMILVGPSEIAGKATKTPKSLFSKGN